MKRRLFGNRRRPAAHLLDPSLVITNLSLVSCRSDFHHPFGSQASGGYDPSALGFVSRPYDRFTLIEDEEATGLCDAGVPPTDKETRFGRETLASGPPPRGRPTQEDAYTSRLYMEPRSDFPFVKSAARSAGENFAISMPTVRYAFYGAGLW